MADRKGPELELESELGQKLSNIKPLRNPPSPPHLRYCVGNSVLSVAVEALRVSESMTITLENSAMASHPSRLGLVCPAMASGQAAGHWSVTVVNNHSSHPVQTIEAGGGEKGVMSAGGSPMGIWTRGGTVEDGCRCGVNNRSRCFPFGFGLTVLAVDAGGAVRVTECQGP
jgi:hypothetical protein